MNYSIEQQREKIIIKSFDKVLAAELSKELSVPLAVGQILVQRGLKTVEECTAFFNPQVTDFHDPFLFADMEKAVDRIMKAVRGNQRISVYGDYDVDGITATVILVKTIENLGGTCGYYLPNRLTDGYGMSPEGVRALSESGT